MSRRKAEMAKDTESETLKKDIPQKDATPVTSAATPISSSSNSPLLTFITTVVAPIVVFATLLGGLAYSPTFSNYAVRLAGSRLPLPMATFVERQILVPLAAWKETGLAPGEHQCLDRRMVVTDFLTETECQALIKLADLKRTKANVGDELSGTDLWEIEAMKDQVDYADVKVLNETRYRMLEVIWRNLPPPPDKQIFFDYSHLTSRLPGSQEYSHGIHADSCLLSHDRKSCEEKPDNCCAWRTRSALLYLNGAPEVEGGEFVFAGLPECGGRDLILPPRCGLLVAFTSGIENPHGVLKIINGTRRALAMWFTFDEKKAEPKFRDAQLFLNKPRVIY